MRDDYLLNSGAVKVGFQELYRVHHVTYVIASVCVEGCLARIGPSKLFNQTATTLLNTRSIRCSLPQPSFKKLNLQHKLEYMQSSWHCRPARLVYLGHGTWLAVWCSKKRNQLKGNGRCLPKTYVLDLYTELLQYILCVPQDVDQDLHCPWEGVRNSFEVHAGNAAVHAQGSDRPEWIIAV